MNILFDHQTFSLQKYGGISRYFVDLINEINTHPSHCATLSVLCSDNVYANRPAPFPTYSFRGRGTLLYEINQLYSKRYLNNNHFDLFHATYYDPYFLKYLSNKPFVITLHDMTHERLSNRFPELIIDKYTTGKHILARKAQAVIAVSENTKQDAIKLLNLDPEKVHVVHHASSIQPIQLLAKPTNPPYLLFVGNRGHYKNFSNLLLALTLLPKSLSIHLICAGGGVFTKEEHEELRKLNLLNKVTHHAFDSNDSLARLYSSALAFVFPSYYEGFGIPVLEAFICGCPCLLSQASSLPEVAGQAALFFDPAVPESIAHTIEKISTDSCIRSSLISRGYQQAAQFSWRKTAAQTLAVYDKVRQ